MASIKFEYLYRDEGNYKEYGEIIYSNPNEIPLIAIQKLIKKNLIEGSWFEPDEWGVPRFSCHRVNLFGINDSLWYEFVGAKMVVDTIQSNCIIDELVGRLTILSENKNKQDWDYSSSFPEESTDANFIYQITGIDIDKEFIKEINSRSEIEERLLVMEELGCKLEYYKMESEIYKSNLQTIDYNFDGILADMILMFFQNDTKLKKTIPNLVDKITEQNPVGYNLGINSSMYELMMKRFLSEYALGMRADEVWKRDYQVMEGYSILKKYKEIGCSYFYFSQSFEEYLYKNTKFYALDRESSDLGRIYEEFGKLLFKLNLQIRFIK